MVTIAWASTYFTKLKTVQYQQKYTARIIFNKDFLIHSSPLLRSLNVLTIYQINVYQLYAQISENQAPQICNLAFEKPTHKYPTQFSETNFKYKKYSLISTKHSISVRGPKIWNEFLTKEEKEIQSHSIFHIPHASLSMN